MRIPSGLSAAKRSFRLRLPGNRPRTEMLEVLFANGAQGRDRTTDTAIFSRMLYQLSYLGRSRRGGRERRFIVRPGSPVHHASPAAPRGAATHLPMAKRARRSPQGEDGLPCKRGANCPKTRKISLNRRLRRHPRCREWRRNSTASGSDRHPGSARNKTGARPRRPACRRSGKALQFSCRLPCRLLWPIPCRTRHGLAA